MINSYDIFDTLIGRLCYNGKEIFTAIENIKNIKDFRKNRTKFETQTKDFDKTYLLLEKHYNTNMSHIKELELHIEKEFSFPIVKYLKNVNPNDIFISDMYLNENQIRTILNKHCSINNKIYVSYGGKSNNIIWKDKTVMNNISCHYGDNIKSDYNNPKNNNINAVHINDTVMNSNEILISSINTQLAYIIRAVRLSNHSNEPLTNPFNEYSLPFALLTCLKIKQLATFNKLSTIVFLSRDGYWFKELYDIMYPYIL